MYISPLGYKGSSRQVLKNVLRVFDYKDYYELRYFPGLIKSGFEETREIEDTYKPLVYQPVELQENIKKETTYEEIPPGSLKTQSVVSRAKKTVYDLAFLNQWSYFITITISPQAIGVDRYDLRSCKKRLLRVFNNYKNRYFKEFKYLILPEKHKDGAWHFHGFVYINSAHVIANGHGYLDFPYLSEKLGFVSLGEIKTKEGAAKYCTKYMSKDLELSVRGYNEHMYFCSLGLERPRCIYQLADIEPEYIGFTWDYVGETGYMCKKMTYEEYEKFKDNDIKIEFTENEMKVIPF